MSEPARGLTLCAYCTGLRAGDIVNLRKDQVVLDHDPPFIEMPPSETKKLKPRFVPLFEPLLSDIRKRIGESEWIYPTSHGKPFQKYSYKTAFNNACKKAKIEDFRFHDLRHCAITNYRRAGIQERVIMSITGHKSLLIHYRYSNVDMNDLKDVARIRGSHTNPDTKNGG